jgi:hypothetical protein
VGNASIIGSILDQVGGAPARAVRLELACECLRAPLTVDTADDGTYGFIDLPAGEYTLRIHTDDGVQTRELQLGEGVGERLDVAINEEGAEAPDDDSVGEVGAAPVSVLERRGPGRRAHMMVRAGVATTISGVIIATGGIFVAALAPCGEDGARGGGRCIEDLRVQIALSLGAIGVATIAAGATLIGVGAKRRKEAAQSSSVQVYPSAALGRRGASLGVVGRF